MMRVFLHKHSKLIFLFLIIIVGVVYSFCFLFFGFQITHVFYAFSMEALLVIAFEVKLVHRSLKEQQQVNFNQLKQEIHRTAKMSHEQSNTLNKTLIGHFDKRLDEAGLEVNSLFDNLSKKVDTTAISLVGSQKQIGIIKKQQKESLELVKSNHLQVIETYSSLSKEINLVESEVLISKALMLKSIEANGVQGNQKFAIVLRQLEVLGDAVNVENSKLFGDLSEKIDATSMSLDALFKKQQEESVELVKSNHLQMIETSSYLSQEINLVESEVLISKALMLKSIEVDSIKNNKLFDDLSQKIDAM